MNKEINDDHNGDIDDDDTNKERQLQWDHNDNSADNNDDDNNDDDDDSKNNKKKQLSGERKKIETIGYFLRGFRGYVLAKALLGSAGFLAVENNDAVILNSSKLAVFVASGGAYTM